MNNQKMIYCYSVSLMRIGLIIVFLCNGIYEYSSNNYLSVIYLKSYDYSYVFIHFLSENSAVFQALYLVLGLVVLFGFLKNKGLFLFWILALLKDYMYPEQMNWGDYLWRYSVLYLTITNCYSYYSFNAKKTVEERLHKTGVVLLKTHFSFIFLSNFYFKIQTSEWISGDALYMVVKSNSRISAVVKEVLLNYPIILKIATFVTLISQLFFGFSFWFKSTRTFAYINLIVIHLGIAFLMQLIKFQIIIILLPLVYYSDYFFKRKLKKQ